MNASANRRSTLGMLLLLFFVVVVVVDSLSFLCSNRCCPKQMVSSDMRAANKHIGWMHQRGVERRKEAFGAGLDCFARSTFSMNDESVFGKTKKFITSYDLKHTHRKLLFPCGPQSKTSLTISCNALCVCICPARRVFVNDVGAGLEYRRSVCFCVLSRLEFCRVCVLARCCPLLARSPVGLHGRDGEPTSGTQGHRRDSIRAVLLVSACRFILGLVYQCFILPVSRWTWTHLV